MASMVLDGWWFSEEGPGLGPNLGFSMSCDQFSPSALNGMLANRHDLGIIAIEVYPPEAGQKAEDGRQKFF